MDLSCPSLSGSKYYVIFVDEYNKFSWLYPLLNKSKVPSCFIKFKLLVENIFDSHIKYLQSDNGGGYTSTAFKNFLSKHGIFHRLMCPHTPQQNEIAERKHRHILETGLTLLAQFGLPPKYWVDAFFTTVFLINRLPSPILDNHSPFFKLFKKTLDYTLLCTFGCLCYPLLRSYAAHKLTFRSKPCIFLEYGANQRGYRCLEPHSKKVYLSRSVVFDEAKFLAKSPNIPQGSCSITTPPGSQILFQPANLSPSSPVPIPLLQTPAPASPIPLPTLSPTSSLGSPSFNSSPDLPPLVPPAHLSLPHKLPLIIPALLSYHHPSLPTLLLPVIAPSLAPKPAPPNHALSPASPPSLPASIPSLPTTVSSFPLNPPHTAKQHPK
jgi:hypothetical protein